MNLILIVLLLGGAFVMMQSGSTFIALLLVILAALSLLGGGTAKAGPGPNVRIHEPYGPDGPIIVENKMPDLPKRINLKIKNDWHEYQGFEYAMMNAGSAANNLGNFLTKLIFGSGRRRKPDGGDDHDGGHGGGQGGHNGHGGGH